VVGIGGRAKRASGYGFSFNTKERREPLTTEYRKVEEKGVSRLDGGRKGG